eukprot:11054432-Lingulodinium_polyedra.AAC.1
MDYRPSAKRAWMWSTGNPTSKNTVLSLKSAPLGNIALASNAFGTYAERMLCLRTSRLMYGQMATV